MRQADYVLVTSGPSNVDMGYSSGTPASGVGVGNAPAIIDGTADISEAVQKIVASKIFDYGTSCSSESALLIEAGIYDQVLEQLQAHGGYLVMGQDKAQLEATIWKTCPEGRGNGRLNRAIVAKSPRVIAQLANLNQPDALNSKFLIVEEQGIGKEYPFSGEKLSVVLAIYKYQHFDEALDIVHRILSYMGLGHSCGIHSENQEHIERLAHSTKVATVLVNQPHGHNNSGGFDNGLAFTLAMGSGTSGKTDNCENLTYKHFLNFTYLSRPIPPRIPSEEELWGDYLARYGD